jgi:hypothetical protein
MTNNPRVTKQIKEIDNQIAKLQEQKNQILNYRSGYEQFHLNRIEDILFKGTVETVMNGGSPSKISLSETAEKLDFIISSLFEMGIIEEFAEHNKIQKGIRDFFQVSKHDRN